MGKLVKASGYALRQSIQSSRKTVTETRKAVRTESKLIDYKLKLESMKKRTGNVVSGMLRDFDNYSKKVEKYVGSRGLTAVDIVTPEVRARIIEPYKKFLSQKYGAKSIQEAVDSVNEKRAKDIVRYGSKPEIVADINAYYDELIRSYILPLQVIEVQFKSSPQLAGRMKFDKVSNHAHRLLATAETVEPEAEPYETEETKQVPDSEYMEL